MRLHEVSEPAGVSNAPQGRSTRLDIGTKLVDQPVARWVGKAYVEAGEAVWYWSGSSGKRPSSGKAPETIVPGDDGSSDVANLARAERRARTSIRRYCASNGIDRLWSLTYGPPFCFDPEQLRGDLGRFIRRVRRERGDVAFPYVWVPELHKDGERLHAHVGLAEYVKKADVQRMWPHGFVDGRRIRGRRQQTEVQNARTTARYLAKYVGKAFAPGQPTGLHRYEVGQGFQPEPVLIEARTEDEAFGQIVAAMGGQVPDRTWRSEDFEDGEMPPLIRGGSW